jgi:hypothetical protein
LPHLKATGYKEMGRESIQWQAEMPRINELKQPLKSISFNDTWQGESWCIPQKQFVVEVRRSSSQHCFVCSEFSALHQKRYITELSL